VSRARLRTLTVGPTTGDWLVRRRLVAEFLGLPVLPSTAWTEPDLGRFAGRYRSETGKEARVNVRDGDLVMEGPLWRGNRLLPRAAGVFDAEAWPFRLTFETDPAGTVTRLRLEGSDLGWGRLAGLYVRVA
jgi:hypothetical protein